MDICPKCGNELSKELGGGITPENDYTYERIWCESCGWEDK